MKLLEIIDLISKRLEALKNRRVIATATGDLQQIYTLDIEIEETEVTLQKLKTLPT